MKRLVHGVGINDANCVVTHWANGSPVICNFYKVWQSMLGRAYSAKIHKVQPAYIGCSVCDEWHIFSNFRKWMENQDWQGKQLDKDLLIQGNNVYCPESCIFVSSALNKLLMASNAARGKYPIGVCFNKLYPKYKSTICIGGKNKHLGSFDSISEAHAEWQKAKAEIIQQAANEQTDERIKNALMLRVNQLRDDLAAGRETVKL